MSIEPNTFPKVSIITVCFNSETTIRDTLESVLSQDYPNIEYIIIDGGSTDKTLVIIKEYKDRIAQIISEKDRGIYDAMNKGIQLATGEIVGMLNSDDTYINKSAITELIQAMLEAKTDSIFADLIIVDAKKPNQVLRLYDSSQFAPHKFKFGWMPAHPTFFTKKNVYDTVGPYSLNYQISADYEMLVRILWVHKTSYTYFPQVLVKMKSGGTSTSGLSRNLLLNQEIVRACRANGINTNLGMLMLKIPQKLSGILKARLG